MKPLLDGVPVCAGVDWITVTARPGGGLERLREQSFALAAVEMSNGNFGKPWRASGYEGFIVGGVSYGERYDGCIFQLTGVLAADHWRRAYENCTSVTRVDLQVTFRTTEDPARVILRHHKELQRANRKRKKPLKLRIIKNEANSITVYTGAPSSDLKGRIYDKGRESLLKCFEGCVRYESVFRKDKAKALAFTMASRIYSSSAVAVRSLRLFSDRGCSVTTLNDKLISQASIDEPKYPIQPSSAERTARWLGISVRPSVLRLIDHMGQDAVLEILGLH